MRLSVLDRVNRFNATHPWDHNKHHHRWILRQTPRSISSALDVGCGTGDLARLLATRAAHVDAVDTDQEVLGQAIRATPPELLVHYRCASLLDVRGPYHLVTAVAVLHHVDLGAALRTLRAALAPGGTLLVVGCYRGATTADHLTSLVAAPANMAVGLLKNRRAVAGLPVSMTAPTKAATTTLREIQSTVATELPGATVRRALFWRYLLRYDAPSPGR